MSSTLIKKSVCKLSAYVPGEQPKGRTFIKLNTNENPYPPSPQVAEALRTLDPDVLRKYPNPTSEAVRERLAELHGCAASNVFVGNGSDEVLALCTRAFVEDSGSMGYFDPSYSLYPVLADIRDVGTCPVALDAAFGWQTPPADLCSLFILTNPNAPTSMLFDKQQVEAFCASFKGVVLIDEAYVDFSSVHCMDLAMKYDNVLVMRTLSKSFSLAAVRVGYAVGSEGLINALMKIKDSYNLDGIAQALTLAALKDMDYMRLNAERIIASRAVLSSGLKDLGFDVCASETNFVWVQPPDSIFASDLFEKLRESGILTRYFPGPKTGHHVRISVGTENEVEALLSAVLRICKEDS